MFTKAIVRTPCRAMIDGLTSADLGLPDYPTALAQHADYVRALQECGLEVTELASNEAFPDSCFVEDVALMTPNCAIITRPGAESRQQEAELIAPVVADFHPTVASIEAPGTVEAGDIMMVGTHYYIGLSERTNQAGAEQMVKLLKAHGLSASIIPVQGVLHLKTGITYIGNNTLLALDQFANDPAFASFNIIEVPAEESYAANCIAINDTLLMPKGYPATKQQLLEAGFELREVEMSEFRKIDGGLTCLSLRF